MGIVALVLLTVTFAWTMVTGGGQAFIRDRAQIHHYWFESGRALKRMYEYQPPARKSVVVDTSGMAYRSADGSQMTKRDRSRPFPRLDVQLPTESVAPRIGPESVPAADAPVIAVAPAPLRQGQVEEIPLNPGAIPPRAPSLPESSWSLGRRVQFALKADPELSRSAQLTLRAVSIKDKVTLSGIVLDQKEKDHIVARAEEIAGAGNVENRLTVL